jgi:iron(III) transport system substrate-binding protein
MSKHLKAGLAALLLVPALASAQLPPGYPTDYANTVAAARLEGKVVVYSVLSNAAAAPLVNDFRALYPGIAVEYDGEKGSTEMADWFAGEIAQGRDSADVVWSSAMDLQMRFVQQGYASSYRSPEAAHLPAWANYGDLAYGTTFEPIAFVYNKELVQGADIPQDHPAFARLMAERHARFNSKVTTFDITKSGVGFMFAVADSQHMADMPGFLNALGSVDVRPSAGTGAMLAKINSGEYLLGYHLMGAYAMARAKKDLPNLGVVLPKDYTLVLSRVMFISKRARHPNAARLWADYLLSRRGQKILGDALELFTIRDDVDAEYTAAQLMRQLGASARPIPLSPELAASLDSEQHAAFIARWNGALAAGRAR